MSWSDFTTGVGFVAIGVIVFWLIRNSRGGG